MLSSTFSPGGNSTVFAYVESADNYQSATPGSISKTSKVRNTERSISMNGSISTEHSRTFQNVSTTPVAELRSSGIVTAPISSAVNANYTSVKSSQTAVPELLSSKHEHQSNETSMKTLSSNSTAIFLLFNGTLIAKDASSNFSISKTSEYVRRTTEVSPSVPSVVSPPANKTSIYYTTVSPRGNIQWTNISANLSGYEGSIGLNRSRNRTAVMSYITASPHPSTSKSSSSSRIDMVNKSENSPASSTVLLLLNTTQGVRSINFTVVSLSKNVNSSSGTIPNSSSIQWKAEEIISSTSTSTGLSSTLLPSQLNNNKTSRVRSGVSKFGNISATVSVIPASSTRELNSSHDEHCGINTSHSSYIIPAQSGILLNISSRTRQELKTKVYLSSSSMPVPSLNTDVWNVSSAKEQHLAASSRNDMFGNSTIAIGSGATSVSRYLNKTSAIGHTADVYSTSLLPTLTLFTEQIIRNTTSTSLSKGNHTATLMFSKSIRSMAANMSSVDSIEKTTTNWKVNSSSQFLNGISPSHNSTLNIKPFTSLASERQKTEKKSKELLTGSHNISSSIVVFNLPPSVVWTTVSSPLKYSTTHASWSVPFLPKVLSTSVSSSIATSKADIPFGRKSSVQINSSQSPASSRFDLPTEGHSNINAVINSTNQVYYGSSTIQSSSDLFVYSTAEVTNRSFPIVQPSSSLPVLTNSSNMIRVSVVPIYTPCYISYMVTVSRIVTHSFVASTVDIETGATSSVQQPSFPSHSNDQSHAGSTPLQPTPSTRFFAQHSSTEMFSKSPTESLSRLPGHVESSMQTKHDAAMTKSNTRSATMNKPNYTQAHNFTKSDNSISNVAVSSSVLHELTVNRNLTAGIRNHTTLLIDHSRSTSVQNFPVKISKSLNTFPLPNKSTSIVDKYVNFNVSITTTTTTTVMNLTSPILNVRMSSNAPAKSELAYTSMIENATTLGHSVRSGSNSVNKSSHQSSNISSRSVLRQETSLVATTTSPLFTKHITLHPTQSSSVQLGIALSTVSAKQVHQTVSPIVNISDVQSSISFYNSSFSNLSRNVTTSQDAHATPSLNHMFSNRSNPTVTAYFNRHDTSVPLSYSRFSFNLTNVRIYGTTLSTLATVTNRRTTAQSTRTENRNLPQPTPVLSRTPSLNNLSVVLSSSIPMLTSKESLLNQNTSAKSTLRNVSGFVNSTLILLSSSTESNMSIFSYKPTVESTSSLDVPSLSNRTTVGLNSNSGGNKTMLVTPSIPVVSRHTRNATHGQNVLPIVSATISKENIQFISIEVIRASSIWPTVVLATGSNLNSQWTSYKNDHTSNSFPDKTISYSSFHVTPSISSSGKPETNPLRRKRRELRNLTVMQDNIGTNSTKNVIKNATTTSTVNISILLLNTSSWKMKEESVELRSTERFLPTQTGSLHQTVKTRFTPTPVINASKATPSPVLVTTSSLEKRFMTSSWNLSFSRLANESRSLTNGYNSLSVPILSPSVEIDHSAASMVSPKRTSSAITSTVRNSSLVETFLSPNNSSIVSSTTNSVNEDRRLMTASASQLASSQGMNTEQYNTSITNGTNSDRNSRLSNRSSLILLTPTITQKQRIMITQSTSIHQSVALTPSITIYKKSVSSNLKMSAKQAVMSTSLDVGMISNSSIINYSSLISTAKSISSPNITLSMTQGKYEKKVNASESTLNTSMTASLNIGSGTYPPTIQDSSYISTTQYTSSSNRTSFSSQLRHETNIQVSKSLVNTGILESTMMSRTQLLVKSLLYSLTYARMNVTTTNNTIRTESNVTAVKSTNSVFPPTSIDDENSRNTSQMRISHSSTSLRLVLETSVGNESLALMPSPVTTLHTSVTAEKLSLYQSENMYSVVNSSPRMMLSSAGTFKFSHHSFISVSSSPTSSFHNSSSDNIRTTSLVKSTLSRAITNGLIPQSSENVTSSISPASVSAHSHNVTSLIHGNISDASSTVSTSYISVTQSPSPSFSIIGSKGITATPTLSKESYISSAAILSQSSSLTTTDGKDHFVANSSVTLPGESSSILSRILRTESRSKVIVITSEKQSGGYYLIPTSSLGLCLVSYSTIFVNISVKTPVTLNTTPVNTTSSLQTPLSMPSSGEINSTRIFTSSVVLRSNVRTSGVLKPSLVSSLVVNKSSISVNYSGVILSTSPFKTSYSGMNTTSLGQYLSKSAGNTTIFQSSTMAYSKPLPITSQTDIPVLPSPTLPKATATYTSKTYTSKTYTVINISPNMSLTSSLYQISPTVSSIVQSSSVATTHTPTSTVDENSILVIALKVPESTNVSTIAFKAILEEKLYQIYQKGLLVQRKRRKRSTLPDSRVEVQNIQRNGQEVDVKYIVIASNRTLLAEDAAKIMDVFTVQKMSSIIGYEVSELFFRK
ncbi:Hypothetical predicted protein [Paramuricea clavata]|uniref:Uncharacterized protein n=1 Tax=Paramuricea clavata TaxID=317549 RepID=A0A7D9IUZ6_PARCT|nr:Hypothetical predicted protein [Paramuricea clavata]